MKSKLKKLKLKINALLPKHQAFVVILALLVASTFVVYRLYVLSSLQPDQDYIDDQTLKFQSVQFDEEAVEKIEALKESNVKSPGTDIQKDRNNPFAE